MFRKINDKILSVSIKFKFFLEEFIKSKKFALIILIIVLSFISLLAYTSVYIFVNKGFINKKSDEIIEKEEISNPVFPRIAKKNSRLWSPNK